MPPAAVIAAAVDPQDRIGRNRPVGAHRLEQATGLVADRLERRAGLLDVLHVRDEQALRADVEHVLAAVDVARIDQLNIYHASLLAMRNAVVQLAPAPDHLLVDAVRLACDCPQTNIIHGDALSISIAAASIVAKVARDEMIRRWDPVYPQYDLASNKGYRSPKHQAALKEFGPTPLHRLSFAPVWMCSVVQGELNFVAESGEDDNECD